MEEFNSKAENSNKKETPYNNKIKLNSFNDLLKIPINELLSIDVNLFYGKLYKKIFDEAINQENKKVKKNLGNNSEKNKTKKLNINSSKTKKDDEIISSPTKKKFDKNKVKIIRENNTTEKRLKKEKKIQKSKFKKSVISKREKNVDNNFNKTFNNFYKNSGIIKKLNFEEEEESNTPINNYSPLKKNKNIEANTTYINENKLFHNNNNNSYIKNNFNDKNNLVKPQNYKYSYSNNLNSYNNIKDNQLTKRFYSGIINSKNNLFSSYALKKINFVINYISSFGEEVGILGSIPLLGNWDKNRILKLKWNEGHMWKGGIYANNETIKSFEFKFIILQENKIKRWEPGENNVFNYNILFNQIKNKRRGFYNKYNYDYNIYNDELTLNCKWNY